MEVISMKNLKNETLALDLQFFAEDGNPNDSDNGKADNTAAEPKKPDSEPPKDEVKTIPYERFKQVNDDLKMFKQTFESLGIDSIDSLKAIIEDYNEKKKAEEERKRAEMSELERLQADLQAKVEAEQTLSQQLADLKAQYEREKIVNEFIKTAPTLGIPSDRIDAAMKLADLSGVKIEDGKVSGIEDVMKSLVENYSFLVEKPAKQVKPIGEPSNGSKNDEVKTLEAQLEEAKRAKNFNKVIELSNKLKSLIK
jgi:hypothetical protein